MDKLEEYNEIERIAKVVRPTAADMQIIWNLYQKYVDPNAPTPTMNGCTTCGNSIVIYWRNLMNWWQTNKNNFLS